LGSERSIKPRAIRSMSASEWMDVMLNSFELFPTKLN
jgi:hypothetical protein